MRLRPVGLVLSLFVLGCQGGSEPSYVHWTSLGPHNYEDYARKHLPQPTDSPEAAPAAEPTRQPKSLADLQTLAALHSPMLEAAWNRWQGSVETIVQSKTLPDPKLTYSYYFLEVETRTGPQREAFSLAQTFPWFGKLELRGQAAAREAEAQWAAFQAAKLDLYAQVAHLYAEYYYLGRSTAITADNDGLLGQVEPLLRTRYATQSGVGQAPLLRLQVERGKLADRLASLRERARPVRAQIAAMVGLSPEGFELPFPESLPDDVVHLDSQRLTKALEDHSPALQAQSMKASAAETRVALARKNYWPDVTLGGTYIDVGQRTGASIPSDSGKDAVIGMVTVNLPIWRASLDAAVRQARNAYWSQSAMRRQILLGLQAQLADAVWRIEDARRKLDLYDQVLLPQAKQAMEATQAAIVRPEGNLTDIIDSERVLLEFQLARARALADHNIARADIEAMIGVGLSEVGNPPDDANVPPEETPDRATP